MHSSITRPRINAIQPQWAVQGGRVTVEGTNLISDGTVVPIVHLGAHRAQVVTASARKITVVVPKEAEGGHTPVRIEGALGETGFVEIGEPVATGIHQVDSPAVDSQGRIYLTYSGTRGEQSPVSLFRVENNKFRAPFASGITNATSLAFSPDGRLHVSSRFEGVVYCVSDDGTHESFVSDLGVACGLAFSPDGTLYVGDRSGMIFRVSTSGQAVPFAELPASVAAFHLAAGPDGCLYVTAPTLSPCDSVYRVDQNGKVELLCSLFGRPQGLAFDAQGHLYVVEALAGLSGIYRVDKDGTISLVLAALGLVGLAFDPRGGMIVVSNDTAYRLNVPLLPFRSGP